MSESIRKSVYTTIPPQITRDIGISIKGSMLTLDGIFDSKKKTEKIYLTEV